MIQAESKDIDTVIKALQDGRRKFLSDMRSALLDRMNAAVERLSTYPPETKGNQPPPPYWARGKGRVHANGDINPVSQQYTQSWMITDRTSDNDVTVMAQTDVTYAPWVVGTKQQAWFHGQNGWPTVRGALQQVGLNGADELVNGEITPPQVLQQRIAQREAEINAKTG